jgi:6-phosphogluconolactonase (cycloisomerase 2 family)
MASGRDDALAGSSSLQPIRNGTSTAAATPVGESTRKLAARSRRTTMAKLAGEEHRGDTFGSLSRRVLLGGAAALAVGSAAMTAAAAPDEGDGPGRGRRRDRGRGRGGGGEGGTTLAYVGTYTPNGQGIHQFRVDPGTGALTPLKVFASSVNPSWIAFGPGEDVLYSANEISNFNGTTTGSVSAYAVDDNGDLSLMNTVSSGGAGPAHLSVDPLGKYVFVANYGGGNVAVLPINADGSLASPSDVKADASACAGSCPVGPTKAAKAPPGSFAISGHDAPHAHMIQTDPAGKYVIVNDLGLDLTQVWTLDRGNGTLTNPRNVPSSPGAGPRHFAFHPNGRWFYSLNEEASTLTFMTYDPATGTLTPVQETSTLPAGFAGTNFTSEVMVSPDGRFVYAANRLHDTIAVFEIGRDGRVRLLGEEWTRGDYPRSFGIEPSGRYMYVCNHRGDAVTTFRIEGGGRELRFTGQYTPVGSPAVITFLRI